MRAWLALAVGLVACGGGGGGLGVGDVTGLPDGDAQGSALSGTWTLERRTLSCSGTCTVNFTTVCTPGETLSFATQITQSDGHLDAVVEHDLPDHYQGGVNADGTFTMGAVDGVSGVSVYALAEGSFSGTSMTGTAEVHGVGQGFDCTGRFQLTAHTITP
jgi:hypothetical protein